MTRRALFVSPYNAVTCGADGTVRLFSYAARRQLFSTVFAAPASFLAGGLHSSTSQINLSRSYH